MSAYTANRLQITRWMIILGVTLAMIVAAPGAGSAMASTTEADPYKTLKEQVSQEDVQRYLAVASEVEDGRNVTGEMVTAAISQFEAAGFESSVSFKDGALVKTFDLGYGMKIGLSEELAKTSPGQVVPMIGGGFQSGGVYITFNNTDQRAIATGAGIFLGAAICAIPAVGWVACGFTAAIIGTATVYLNTRGICPNNRVLKISANYAGQITGSRCL